MARRLTGFYNKETEKVEWYDSDKLREASSAARWAIDAPMVIQDTMDPTKHPGTGKYYESKSAFDRDTEAAGYVPWSPPKDWDSNCINKPPPEDEIAADYDQAAERALNDLKWGAQELSEDQKAYASEINKAIESKTGKSAKLEDLK